MVGVLTSDAGVRRAELHFLQLCDYSAPGGGEKRKRLLFAGARRAADIFCNPALRFSLVLARDLEVRDFFTDLLAPPPQCQRFGWELWTHWGSVRH